MNESTTQARVATMKSSINIIVEPKSTMPFRNQKST
jgi:hypothetical protein